MAAFKSPEVQEEVVANLIPMIDIMFLLLLFFMLGSDMAQRQFEDVELAVAASADEDKKEDSDVLTVNVHHLPASEVSCPEFFTEKPEDQKQCRFDAADPTSWSKHWSSRSHAIARICCCRATVSLLNAGAPMAGRCISRPGAAQRSTSSRCSGRASCSASRRREKRR